MKRAVISFAALLAMAAALATTAWAQVSPIVGLWSSSQTLGDGTPYSSYWLLFNPDGTFQERIIYQGGVTNYVGQYQYDPASGFMQFFFVDYEPKMDCTFACIPIPPMFALNSPFTVQVQMNGPNELIWVDAGTPMAFTRQQ